MGKKLIPISELEVGMFVEEVIGESMSCSFKHKGQVLTVVIISAMKEHGVKHVLIIPEDERMDIKVELKPIGAPIQQRVLLIYPLLKEVSELQELLYKDVRNHTKFDFGHFEKIAIKLSNLIFKDSEAVKYALKTRLRSKSHYLFEHAINVAGLLGLFSQHLGFGVSITYQLILTGLLYDLGDIMIPNKIKNKK